MTVFLNSCSRWHAACTFIGVAHPPCSRSALPCVRVTHYGLSKQMACPQRWYNFLGGRSCETKCHLSTHGENAISCSHPRKQNLPCPSALSVTIESYSHLDPPLIRRSSVAEMIIIFIKMTVVLATMKTIVTFNSVSFFCRFWDIINKVQWKSFKFG